MPVLLQALSSLLKQSLRGYFIPPRPEKKGPVEGQLGSVDFVEQRRASLERWLQQLAAHPVIAASDVRSSLTRPPTRVGQCKQAAWLTRLDFRLGFQGSR